MNLPNSLPAYLTQLLYDLEGIEEPLPHHPEENALVHSLQVFQIAMGIHDNDIIVAAALLHDIGKVQAIKEHAALGADLLKGMMPDHLVWLVEHHMDLVYDARRTERVYRNTHLLSELKLLRKWDLQGRRVNAQVCSVEFAVDIICDRLKAC